jgi:hypothetical protein
MLTDEPSGKACGLREKNQSREVLPLFKYFKDLKHKNQQLTHNNRLADTVHVL